MFIVLQQITQSTPKGARPHLCFACIGDRFNFPYKVCPDTVVCVFPTQSYELKRLTCWTHALNFKLFWLRHYQSLFCHIYISPVDTTPGLLPRTHLT